MNVNFTVFIDKILSGEKRQTIRRASQKWENVKAGDKLTLYTGLRTKQCRKLGEAKVASVHVVMFDTNNNKIFIFSPLGFLGCVEIAENEARSIAVKDGFVLYDDFWNFFKKQYGRSGFLRMVIIRWHDFKRQSADTNEAEVTQQ